MDSGVPTLAATTDGDPGSSSSLVEVEPGDTVGRYRVIETIGRGGMGVVFAAHDPDLERKVALKVVPTRGDRAAALQERVGREAQSLARVSHPNVVKVFDVGPCDGGVFLAMEWIDGVSARAWRSRSRPTWREIVRVYVEAGRGLAAAHAAGVVHRDFKPDNVLVDRDGHAHVVDFGLAQAIGSEPSREDHRAGTPAYMAAERHGDERVDERVDQFSFCVALYEQLVGARPFVGETPAEIAIQIMTADPRPIPPEVGLPVWLEHAILRGLHRDAVRRHASMDALLVELDRERSRRRWRGAVMGGGALALVVAAALVVREPGPDCASGAAAMADTWEAAQRDALDARLATAPTWIDARRTRFLDRIDAYASAWIAARDAACRATHVEGTQTAEELDRRMACLDGRRRGLAALVEVFGELDPAPAYDGGDPVGRLADVAACADPATLDREAPLPADPVVRQRLIAFDDDVARVEAYETAGRWAEARDLVTSMLDTAAAIDPRRLARAERLLGWTTYRMGDHAAAIPILRRAFFGAVEASDSRTAMVAAEDLAILAGYVETNRAIGMEWIEHGRVHWRRIGAPPRDEVRLLSAEGAVVGRHDPVRASEILTRQVEVVRQETPHDHAMLAGALINLALVEARQAEHARAAEHAAEAITLLRDALGDDHPHLASALMIDVAVAVERGDLDAAAADLAETRRIREATLPAGHPGLAVIDVNEAELLRRRGDRRGGVAKAIVGYDGVVAAKAAPASVREALHVLLECEADAGENDSARARIDEYERLVREVGLDPVEHARAMQLVDRIRALR